MPTLKVAVTGAATSPVTPWPIPLKKPFTPFSLAPFIGLVNTPVTPVKRSLPVSLSPYVTVLLVESL